MNTDDTDNWQQINQDIAPGINLKAKTRRDHHGTSVKDLHLETNWGRLYLQNLNIPVKDVILNATRTVEP